VDSPDGLPLILSLGGNEWKNAIKKSYGTEYDIDERGFQDYIIRLFRMSNKHSDYYEFPEGRIVE